MRLYQGEERETDRQTDTDRQTGTDTERQTGTERQTERDRERERQTERQTDREREDGGEFLHHKTVKGRETEKRERGGNGVGVEIEACDPASESGNEGYGPQLQLSPAKKDPVD